MKPPSIHDWIKKRSIANDKLPKLWRYFSDVVGPDQWGLRACPDMGPPRKSHKGPQFDPWFSDGHARGKDAFPMPDVLDKPPGNSGKIWVAANVIAGAPITATDSFEPVP